MLPLRSLLVVAGLLCGCSQAGGQAPEAVAPPPVSQEALVGAIRERWTPPSSKSLERVEVSAVTGEPGLYVALFDSAPRWFGDWACFSFKNGRVDWVATLDEDEQPDAPAMESIRGFRLPGFDLPLVEVFSRTHMGNGALYLYELRGRRLHRIFETRAVDFHWGDGAVIRGGVLRASYSDINGDGVADITLTGVVDEVEDSGRKVVGSGTVHETFVWDAVASTFVQRSD